MLTNHDKKLRRDFSGGIMFVSVVFARVGWQLSIEKEPVIYCLGCCFSIMTMDAGSYTIC